MVRPHDDIFSRFPDLKPKNKWAQLLCCNLGAKGQLHLELCRKLCNDCVSFMNKVAPGSYLFIDETLNANQFELDSVDIWTKDDGTLVVNNGLEVHYLSRYLRLNPNQWGRLLWMHDTDKDGNKSFWLEVPAPCKEAFRNLLTNLRVVVNDMDEDEE